MKKFLLVIVIGIAAYAGYIHYHPRLSESPVAEAGQSDSILAKAFANHVSNLQVQSQGIVARVLPDDNDGSRHQRFIIRLSSSQTILIAHNIDLAPRVSSLREGDSVSISGTYEWNSKGGVVHWTHRDPSGGHAAGWIKHNSQTFE
jgi:hypothetical protein